MKPKQRGEELRHEGDERKRGERQVGRLTGKWGEEQDWLEWTRISKGRERRERR